MKTLKYLTICFVLCCLFTGNVFGQFHGISFLKETADSAMVGDPVNVSFLILNSVDQCQDTLEVYSLEDVLQTSGGPVSSGEILSALNWQFQNGAGWNNDTTKDFIILPFGGIAQSDAYSYYTVQQGDVALGELVDQAQLGWTDTCAGGQTCGNCATNPEVASASGSTTVLAPIPCVDVTKTACPYSKVGDIVTYDITISNCGDDDLDIFSVNDSLLGDITAEATAAGCGTLPVGGSCNFQVMREVQPGDPEPLVNIVEVNYTGVLSGETVTADNDAVVTLLHPSFTEDVECLEIVNDVALFEVTFCNTGDVDLMVDPLDGQITPFPLPVGECASFIVEVPVDQTVCGAGSATKTIAALASIIMPPNTPPNCELGNIITPVPAEDTATCTAEVNPDFTADKVCLDTTPLDVADGFADFQINFTNTGDVPLLFDIQDPAASYSSIEGPIPPGVSGSVVVSVPTSIQACPADDILNAATVAGICFVDGTPVRTDPVDATCPGACADFDVEKICLTDTGLMDGDIAEYGIVITNTGDVPLDLIIDDPSAEPPLVAVPVTLGPGETYDTTVSRTVVCAEPGQFVIENTVSVIAIAPDGSQIGPKSSTAECPYECGGNEGCTPGFWKNHTDCWCDAYEPTDPVAGVFSALQDPNYIGLGGQDRKDKWDVDTDTLNDSIRYRGGDGLAGSVRNMLRHATAALLNGCSSDVGYPISDSAVIELVNFALDSEDIATIQDVHTLLADWNEDSPCPIDAHCRPHDDVDPE